MESRERKRKEEIQSLELSEEKQDKEEETEEVHSSEVPEENEEKDKNKNRNTLNLQTSELKEKQPSTTEGLPLDKSVGQESHCNMHCEQVFRWEVDNKAGCKEDKSHQMEASINSIPSELGETVKTQVGGVVSCPGQKTQGLGQEATETQVHIRASHEARTRSFQKTLGTTKSDFRTKLEARATGTEALTDQRNIEAKTEATRRELQSQLEAVVTRAEREGEPGACARTAQRPTFDGNTSWAVFRRQFETVAEHNYWTHQEKSTYLITALKGRAAAEVLYEIPTSATYGEILQILEDRFGDQHFAVNYRCQLKTRTQMVGESLQDFAMAIEELVHRAYPALPEDHIRTEAGNAFADGVKDPFIKMQLLLGGEKTVNEALRQALALEGLLLSVRPHKASIKTFRGNRSPPTWRRDARRLRCWNCGELGHFRDSCSNGRAAKNDRRQKRDERPPRGTREPPRKSQWRPNNNKESYRRDGQPSGNERGPAKDGRRCMH
jgi:hypothetical protein